MFRRRTNHIHLILLLGVVVAYPLWFWEARQARGWPATAGEVIESRVEQRVSRYYPVVAYRYSVDGRSFTSRVIGLSSERQRFGTFQEAQAVIVSYPVGSQVQVRYNPDNPSRAALIINEPPIEVLLAILIGAVIGGFAIFTIRRNRSATGQAGAP